MPLPSLVLVAGATGTTGGEVLRQLRRADVPARALTRSADAAARLRQQGFEAAVGDLAHAESLNAALAGVSGVYVVSPASPDIAAHEGNLAQAALEAGVGHIVKLSVIGASSDGAIDFARLHGAAEEAVRLSGVPATMIRPNGFMQNTLMWAPQVAQGTVYAPVIDSRWAIVDVRDVAAMAVTALRDPTAHGGQSYDVTGPRASSPREQVQIIAELLGRPLRVQQVTIEQAQQAVESAGASTWVAERLAELWRMYESGGAETVSPDVERMLGRPPADFSRFAEDHRAAFAAAQT